MIMSAWGNSKSKGDTTATLQAIPVSYTGKQKYHTSPQEQICITVNRKRILTFWGRNYFFFILAHPVYKM